MNLRNIFKKNVTPLSPTKFPNELTFDAGPKDIEASLRTLLSIASKVNTSGYTIEIPASTKNFCINKLLGQGIHTCTLKFTENKEAKIVGFNLYREGAKEAVVYAKISDGAFGGRKTEVGFDMKELLGDQYEKGEVYEFNFFEGDAEGFFNHILRKLQTTIQNTGS